MQLDIQSQLLFYRTLFEGKRVKVRRKEELKRGGYRYQGEGLCQQVYTYHHEIDDPNSRVAGIHFVTVTQVWAKVKLDGRKNLNGNFFVIAHRLELETPDVDP